MTPKKTLKKWFSNLMKPAQEHFSAWIDSYWHKSEQIPMSNIEGLSRAIENTVSAKQLLNHLEDTNAHSALFDELKRQIQAIQTILQVDDVNLDTLQEIVTELKANTKLQELIDKKVNKEDGKGLSANDFTNEHKQKLEELQPVDISGKMDIDASLVTLKDNVTITEYTTQPMPPMNISDKYLYLNISPDVDWFWIKGKKYIIIDSGEGNVVFYAQNSVTFSNNRVAGGKIHHFDVNASSVRFSGDDLQPACIENYEYIRLSAKNHITIDSTSFVVNNVDVLSEINKLKEEVKLLKNNS